MALNSLLPFLFLGPSTFRPLHVKNPDSTVHTISSMVLAIAHGPFNVHDINGRSTSLVCRGRTPRFVQKWDPEMAISMTKMIITYYTLRIYSGTPKFLDLIPVQGSGVTDPEDARQWKWNEMDYFVRGFSHVVSSKRLEFPMDFPLPKADMDGSNFRRLCKDP